MRKLGTRALAIAVVAVALVTGCTSDPDEAGGGGGGGGGANGGNDAPLVTTGVTDDTIRIGYLGADFGPLIEAGLAPDLGDQEKVVQAVVEQINEDGGIAGRQVEVEVRLVDGVSGPDEVQAACLALTQDFGAFAVVLSPAISREANRCLAVTNETLTITPTGLDAEIYEEAEGRLFTAGTNTSMSTNRQYEGWGRAMAEAGVLDGATIGVVTAESSPEFVNAAADSLVPTLEELGHEVAVNAVLPCPEGDTDCDQHESVVQQMKSAGVDVVFMAAANLTGPAFVQAAVNLDFHPQWLANGNQVTDTVSQFFESVADEWDGAIGTSTVFAAEESLTDGAHECNEVVTERSGEEYAPGSDAFGFTAGVCLNFRLLPLALADADSVDQASAIAAIEALGSVEVNAGPDGTLGPDKHDAGDYLFLADYDADAGEFVDREGEPFEVAG